jgi:membrane protease YdiL (CAAX protease family)
VIAGIVQAALTAFLLVIFPLWDRRETRRLKADPSPAARIRAYRITIAWQIVATALLLAVLPARLLFAPPVEVTGLGIRPSLAMGTPILVGLLVGAAVPVLMVRGNVKARERIRQQFRAMAFFLPQTPAERRWFAATSVVVGVCEEIIFRGWFIRWAADPPLGLIAGAIASAIVFGVDHGYQGIAGMLATGVMALVLTALFFASGTLWLPIVVHALIDLRILLLLRAAGPLCDGPAGPSLPHSST